MHIPDGYLSPTTCGTFFVASAASWTAAGRKVRKVVKNRYVPLLAIAAAYCFLTMMFNVPIPDGTTAHAVGAVLVAVLLGPSAAIIAVSIALAIQALFFGDGGVLAFGANSFNMAVVMPLVGYYLVYRPLTRNLPLASPRRAFAAGLGGYVGLNAAALLAAVEFGLQPILFHRADGTPLYAPFHLSQSIPAMMLAHLAVAGVVEFALTAGVVAYLQRANLPLLRINHDAAEGSLDPQHRRFGWRWGVVALLVMGALTPLGLIAPGSAFGEGKTGHTPIWHYALLNGYDFTGDKHPAVGYLISALLGIATIALVVFALFLLLRLVQQQRQRQARPAPAAPAPPAATARRAHGTGTPGWMVQGEAGLCPCGCIGKRSKVNFVEKTIGGSARLMRNAMFSEDVAARQGFLQRIEPRVKLASLLLLLLATGIVRHIPALLGMYALTLGLAALSALPLGFFIRRVWMFIPVFTGIVVAPATLNIVTHGRIVVPLGHWWFGHPIGLTAQGLNSAGLMITRVAVSISLVVLLTLTTPWNRLLASLRSLGVPRIFVRVLGMCYRYIFHMLTSVTDMYTARKARTVGRDTDVASGRAFVAASAGALFGKAQALSEEVHMAMLSRGFTGDSRTLTSSRIKGLDIALVLCSLATALIVYGGDRVLGR